MNVRANKQRTCGRSSVTPSRPVLYRTPSFLPTSTTDGKEGGFEIGKILKEVDAA